VQKDILISQNDSLTALLPLLLLSATMDAEEDEAQ
jgi:hypothetical protein